MQLSLRWMNFFGAQTGRSTGSSAMASQCMLATELRSRWTEVAAVYLSVANQMSAARV
jgi:hypothetical protein